MARPLKMFMRGKRITMLQEILHRMGYPMHDQAGLFAASTRDGIKAFQKQQGLKVTGTVDDDLFTLLQQGSQPSKQKTASDPAQADTAEHKPCNQQQFDALIQLLVSKNIITEAELHQLMAQPQALRVTQPALV
ncbi:MAG: peptidoglycan-binding domain-containing protein [Mariprofundus sp.]|nr:peptidoglycan-binding domain-containing protein [Mariprofundus sp.]